MRVASSAEGARLQPFVPQRLPIEGVQWEPLIPLIGRANRSLATYEGVLYAVPNPEVLLSPLTTQEAVLSSRIEGTQATFAEVLRFDAGDEPAQESRRLDILEIQNYRKAMRHAETALRSRPFSLNLLLELHAILLDSVRGRDKARGQFRRVQNWIGRVDTPIEKADFIPPAPRNLMEHLDDWEKYYHRDSPDSLVQLAVIHAQFEIIHPFLDGNGRLGRILIPIFLFERGLLSRPTFYLSGYFDAHRDRYFDRLRALSGPENAWNAWVEFFLIAVEEQARLNAEKARAIADLYERLKRRVIDLTHSQYAVPLLDQLFRKPIFSASSIVFEGRRQPSRQLLSNQLRRLRDAGILKEVRPGRGRRAQVLALPELLHLCEGRKVL